MNGLVRTGIVLLIGAAFCAAVSGCFYPAYQAFQSPVPAPPLSLDLGPELGVTAGVVVDTTNYGGESLRLGMTDLAGVELGVISRLGLLPNLDVGVRLSPNLLGLVDVKYRLLSFPLNVAASLGVSWYPRTGALFSTSYSGGMALYPVVAVGTERLFGGLRAVVLNEFREQHGSWQFHPGAYIGGSFGNRMRVMPEFDVLVVNQPGPSQNGYRSLLSAGAGLAILFRI